VFTSISRRPVLRCSLLLGVALIGVFSDGRSASAQTDQSIETVVVTGSRLLQQDLYSSRPLTAIGPRKSSSKERRTSRLS
jgi:hypothetical protein